MEKPMETQQNFAANKTGNDGELGQKPKESRALNDEQLDQVTGGAGDATSKAAVVSHLRCHIHPNMA
jgi:hypothetical protein